MIEFSITELALFAWAVLATGYALKYRDDSGMHRRMMVLDNGMHRRMMVLFLENKEARDRILEEHAKFMKERNA